VNINIDELLRLKDDWSCKLQIDGRDYATREVTEAEFGALHGLLKAGDSAAAAKQIRGFFVMPPGEEPPAVEQWDTRRVSVVLAVLSAYAQERIKASIEHGRRHMASQWQLDRNRRGE
jgi:hypothetical protein